MKLNKLQVSVLSVLLTGVLQCSYSWAGGAAGAGNPAGATGGATNGTVGNGATTNGVSPNGAAPGTTGTGNAGVAAPARPTVNPNQPTSPTGQDINPTANPARKDMNRVDPNTRDTRAGNNMNNTNTRTVPPVPDNGCQSIAGQPTTGGGDCMPTTATPR
ncbi:MAG TPA: hypothetical protein VK958_09380 [Methylophilus sp.]|uniref:hypothetical protein n=1 Tax=Methylophilus sp. TaxID=29541 RepID=UPI002BDD0C83|nr:hypothetical protein [Methylophilus sp.]HSH87445.1 hypothetical protein [Methylophilus sp.]